MPRRKLAPKPPKIKKIDNFKKYQDFVEKLVKPETILWSREIKILMDLISIYGESILNIELNFMLNSLAFFKTEKGMAHIRDFLDNQNKINKTNNFLDSLLTQEASKVNLQTIKTETDKNIPKTKNLFDFLQNAV